jgi:hypothetical protein
METSKNNSTKILLGIIAVLLAVIVGSAAWFFLSGGKKETFHDDDFFDPSAVTGILPGMSEQEIQSALNQVVEEGMLNISISSDISFADGKSKGMANINNVEANHYIVKVAITLDDTGETVYESGGIQPGQYIQYIELAKELAKGDYTATATFTAYTQDTRQIVGSVAAMVNLYVKG